MSRLEPIPFSVLKDFPPKGNVSSPISLLSLAARLEEPDLGMVGEEATFFDLLMQEERPMRLSDMEGEDALIKGSAPSILLLTFSDGQRDGLAVLGKLPLKLLRDFEPEWAGTIPSQPTPEYLALLRTNNAHLDPLLVGWPGLRSDQIEPFVVESSVVHHGVWGGGSYTLRALSDPRRIKVFQKLFEPGFFGAKPNPFVLDGAFSLVKWQIGAGHEHTFAAICPLGDDMSTLAIGEMLVDLQVGELNSVSTQDPLHPQEGVRNATLPALLQLPESIRIQRYYYSGESSRDYAMQDFQEDLHLESVVADTSAILMRGRDEFAMAIGSRSHHSHAVSEMYESGAIEHARRLIVPNDKRAATLLSRGLGDGAVWTPLREGVDYASRILAHRPQLAQRRAAVRLQPAFPFGLVVRSGL